ncbi:hypothetical protein D3C77_678950 [compost metagenome]
MRFGVERRLEALGQLAARHQPRAIGLGNVVVRLGAQGEIGGQFAFEGEALGKQAAESSAAAQGRSQQGQPKGA